MATETTPGGNIAFTTATELNDPAKDLQRAINRDARDAEVKAAASGAADTALSAVARADGAVATAKAYAGEIVKANITASRAVSTAEDAVDTAGNAVDRVRFLEANAQMAPGTADDATTATRVAQSDSLTRAAVNAATAQVVGYAPLWAVHGENANHPRPQTNRPVEWFGSVRPVNMANTDVWNQYEGPRSWFEDFTAEGFAGWSPMWNQPSSWSTAGGALVNNATTTGRKAMVMDDVGKVRDVELVAKVNRTGTAGQIGAIGGALTARASGTTVQANNVILSAHDGMLHLSRTERGTWLGLGSVAWATPQGVDYWLRFLVEGDKLYGKAWLDGATEPAGWMVQATQAAVAEPGWVGAMVSGQGLQKWHQIGIATGGAPAPRGA